MAVLDAAVPIVTWVRWPWNLAGLVSLAFGGALVWFSSSTFTRFRTSIEPFQPPTHLVTVGPYRLSRNPMYLGATLMLIGIAVSLGSITPFLVPPLYMVVIEQRIIRPEEVAMLNRFGKDYERYRASVRRWL